MSQSIEVDDALAALIRHEAKIQDRSFSQQACHWMCLGRALERCGDFDAGQVELALRGELDTTQLSKCEGEIWLDAFVEKMSRPGEEERAFYSNRVALGLGVGLDEAGALINGRLANGG